MAAPQPATRPDAPSENRPLASSIAVERTYRVEGKKVVVRATLPASIADAIGMEAMLTCAQKLLVTLESKEARVVELRLGEG